MRLRIGIDLGGTKIEGVALGPEGQEVARRRLPTPAAAYDQVLDAVGSLVEALEQSGAPASVGVGTPGFLSPGDGRIRNSNLAVLNGRTVDRDLAARLGRPVRVSNDGNCFVLSEALDGAATPAPGDPPPASPDVVFGATLGTGVGGGVVMDGRILAGANGAAAEWSHTTLPFVRPDELARPVRCFCGHPACIESFLSGGGLSADHAHVTGETAPAPVLAARATAGDPAAMATLDRYEDRLARALAGVINLLDPRAVVLGGGLSNNPRLFANVPRLWERYTVARDLRTQLLPARHGDASGVRGAAWLGAEPGTS